jgi:dihydrolipoamide dehydrogenase
VEVETSEGKRTLQAKNVLLATGSVPVELPFLKFDHERIIDSTGALSIPAGPGAPGGGRGRGDRSGAGERLAAARREGDGARGDADHPPGDGREIVKQADRIFRKQGFDIRTGTKVTGAERKGRPGHGHGGGRRPIEADYVLVAVGRRAYTEGMGFEEAGIRLERGVIQVDERYHTGVGEIYAIGDAIGGRMLAHKAEEEGVAAVENMAGKHGHVNYDAVANVVYTWPEIASVGRSEEELKAAGVEYRVGKFPFMANGRAKAMGRRTAWSRSSPTRRPTACSGCTSSGRAPPT